MVALSDNMRGALFMTGGMAAFTLNDTCIKSIDADMPLMQLLALRSVAVIAFLAWLARRMDAPLLPPAGRDRQLVVLRTLAEAAAAWFFLTALRNMPLANATAILQLLPLTVTLAAALIFGERLGWRRLVAIAVGFAGMVMIVRPGGEGFNAFTIYALVAVVAVTVRDLAARRLSPGCRSVTVSLVAAVGVGAVASAGSLATDWQPLTARDGVLLLGASAFVICGYLASVAAMRVGEIGVVAPFRYASLLAALVLGLVVFGEWPAPPALAGAALIVATGLFTLWRERRLGLAASPRSLRPR